METQGDPDRISRESVRQAVHAAEQALRRHGVRGLLAWLNGRTRHRFTGVYVVESPLLTNLFLFDRENPALEIGGESTPLRETYCSITAGGGAPFATTDAGTDERLTTHPARQTVLSYCGVPLRHDGGTSFGTLCHFDLRPRLVPSTEIPVMERAADLLVRELARAGSLPARRAAVTGEISAAPR